MSEHLTDAERETLLTSFLEPDDDCAHNVTPLFNAVEALLAARTAALVEQVEKAEADYMTRSRTAGKWLQRAGRAEAALADARRKGAVEALREAADEVRLVITGVPCSGHDPMLIDDLATAAAQGWLTGRANRADSLAASTGGE